ncbi:MAG: helix-turn-helix domain-containing protein [Gordonia sp. (in: high G+C Gram-positive bacteria)]
MTGPGADEQVRCSVVRVAKRMREKESEIVTEITGILARDIDHLDDDPILVELLEASVHGNVATLLHVFANDISIEHLQPTTAAVEYALRLAQRDVPSNSLVRAYYKGQNELLRQVFGYVGDLGLPAESSMAVMRLFADVTYRYIEWITIYVFQAYEDERRRWIGAESNALLTWVHELLENRDVDTAPFERQIGYSLEQNHLAAIIWLSSADTSNLTVLDVAARELAKSVCAAGPPLVSAIDRSTAWVWIPLGRLHNDVHSADLAGRLVLPGGVRVALGLAGRGVAGFRRSHQQASDAYGLASVPGSSLGDIVGFGDRGVAVVSLLARDLDFTRAWVREVLGELAENTSSGAAFRETLAVYFATGESHLRTAERLLLHRNTVKYRVDKALKQTRAHDHLDLALALTVCEFLGPQVLVESATNRG